MSGILRNVKIDDKEVKTLLTGIQARVKNLTPAMRIIGEIIRASVVKNFEESGRPAKWRPKAVSTIMGGIRKKDFKRGGKLRAAISRRLALGKVLIDTGRLYKSINAKAFSDRAEIGTNVIYSAIHQFGGKAGRGHKVTIPARPYLMVQDQDWTEIKHALTDYLIGKE